MADSNLRIRLTIQRDGLPEIKVVFVFAVNNGTTIAHLLEQVNDTISLETADRGLGDYVVGLGASPHDSFEFLHFQKVKDLLSRDDEVLIRPLSSQDIANRQASGRLQRLEDGDYVLDGVSLERSQLLSCMRRSQWPSSLAKKNTKANGIQHGFARINGPLNVANHQLLAPSPVRSTAKAARKSQQQALVCQVNGDCHAGEIASSDIADASHGTLYQETGVGKTPAGRSLLDGHGEERLPTTGHFEVDRLRGNGQGQEMAAFSASLTSNHQPNGISRLNEALPNDSIFATFDNTTDPSKSVDPTTGSKSTALVLHNGTAANKTKGPANPDDEDTLSVRPGEGKTKTKKRNARRRARRAMEKAREEEKAQGVLGESAAGSLQASQSASKIVSAAQPPKPETGSALSLGGKLSQETTVRDTLGKATQSRQRSPSSSSISSTSISSSSSEAESVMDAPLSDKSRKEESWADKINYRAVECCDETRTLGTPPFPFVQNWNAANGTGDKLSQKQKQKRKAQDGCVSSAEPPREKAQKRRKLSSDDSTPAQPPPSSAEAVRPSLEAEPTDLPPLPTNLATLPLLSQGEATVGMAITWKKWVLSQKTGWEPKVVDVRARVVAVRAEGAEMEVRLPQQDRDIEKRVKRYDMVTGERIYDRFEGPDGEEDEDEDEDALPDAETTVVSFSDMLEPRILRASAV